MPLVELRGNLFNSKAQTLVNTVNCVGVMGKGIALEFRRRFPEMFEAYRKVCDEHKLRPGQILPYRIGQPWILNFAVKDAWKQPSRMEWVEACLERFVANYRKIGITSIAFPWIGAMNGGLPWEKVLGLMHSYLQPLTDIDVEIIEFDPDVPDLLFTLLCQSAQALDPPAFARRVGITTKAATLVYQAVREAGVPSLARLCDYPGIGGTTVEHLYAAFRPGAEMPPVRELPLFEGQ
ncbi:MAG TPA: macro domain-containing protein [Smithellaceae bacterium]|nr:macro domain-containing protein [Smithellaceae bacterium]